MTSDERFETAVRGSDGVWPRPPELWSYSSLSGAETCPRRWMLRRAVYPAVWDRVGYPSRPMLGTIAGNVIHEALELLLRELHKGRCASIRDPAAVAVLRALGGYSSVIERQVERSLANLEGNPRAAPLLSSLRRNLLNRIPQLRQKVQALLARVAWIGLIEDGPVLSGGQPQPLGMGSHTEVELFARDLRFCGRADLITVDEDACVITDFKTGAPDPKHADQLRAYAVLWHRDGDRNPSGCQGSREFPSCDHGNSPPSGRPVRAGRSAAMASRWRRMR